MRVAAIADVDPYAARRGRGYALRATASAAISPRSSEIFLEADLVGLGAREREKILDEARHLLRLLDDPLERFAIGGEAGDFPRSVTSASPRSTVSGVRSSWLMSARKRTRERSRSRSVSFAASSSCVRASTSASRFDRAASRSLCCSSMRPAISSKRRASRPSSSLAERADAKREVAAADGDRPGARARPIGRTIER